MKTAICLVLIGSLAAAAQTNSSTTVTNRVGNQTNKTTAASIASAKQTALVQLNKHFKFDRDKFTGKTTIQLKKELKSEIGVEFNVICHVSTDEPIPDRISLHIVSSSSDWRFLKYSGFIIMWDAQKKDFGELKHDGDVMTGGVLEQMWADFSQEEFRAIAFANKVEAKLGIYGPFQFDRGTREAWRVLSQYFAVLKAEKELVASQGARATRPAN